MAEMTDAERKEIAESMDSMSEKLDTVVKMLNDIIRQNAVIYYSINHAPEKAEAMAMASPSGAKQKPKKKVEIDTGRVKALYAAGWVMKDIAEDCGISISAVYRVLHPEKGHG